MEDVIIRRTFAAIHRLPKDFMRGRRPLIVRPKYVSSDEAAYIDNIKFTAKLTPRLSITGTWRNVEVKVFPT